ncbi:hypothetical protein ABZ914_40890 [Spirillospora sp. NPDC046719]
MIVLGVVVLGVVVLGVVVLEVVVLGACRGWSCWGVPGVVVLEGAGGGRIEVTPLR